MNKFISFVLDTTIIISILTQISEIEFFMRPSMYAAWIFLAICSLVAQRTSVRLSRATVIYICCYAMFAFICLVVSFFGQDRLSGYYLRAMMIPPLVLIIADCNRENFDEEYCIHVFKIYIISSLVFAIYVNINFFSSYANWLRQNVYAYTQKNSAAQIWASAAILSLYLFFVVQGRRKALWAAISVYLLLIIGFSQCRTAILSLFIGGILLTLIISKHKVQTVAVTLLFIGLFFIIPFTREYINQAFLLEKYAGSDINTFSSNRFDLYSRSLRIFMDNVLLGIGKHYVDCSYIMILAESGLIGFALIETIWISRITANIKAFHQEKQSVEKQILLYMTFLYIGESLLEGLPPFGPGVSSFFFWLFSEVISVHHSNYEGEQNEAEYNRTCI